ncbi:MAG TPA: response regulator [Cyclobacteriaceae bacterium]|jgi:CheY-like chemotaxis protein|nr:response regulator [Cyclobacteriaceae bacterium]
MVTIETDPSTAMESVVNTLSNQFILIDDDPINNIISKITIELVLGDANIQSFTSASQGLEHIRSSSQNYSKKTVLLLDLNMPILNGWEFLDRFDSLPNPLKNSFQIYILSSSVDDRDRERSYANKNVVDFLVKPLTKDAVASILNSMH